MQLSQYSICTTFENFPICLISFRLCEAPNECRNLLSSLRIIYFHLRIINYTILSNIIRISLHIMPILYK